MDVWTPGTFPTRGKLFPCLEDQSQLHLDNVGITSTLLITASVSPLNMTQDQVKIWMSLATFTSEMALFHYRSCQCYPQLLRVQWQAVPEGHHDLSQCLQMWNISLWGKGGNIYKRLLKNTFHVCFREMELVLRLSLNTQSLLRENKCQDVA